MSVSNIRHDERGIGLFEVTLILAAAALITAALTPAVLRALHAAREDAARSEMRTLHEAMVGSDDDGTHGFIGDLGRLPYSLDELFQNTGMPLFAAADEAGVGYGWNGPYVNRGEDSRDAVVDPWGTPYDVGVAGPGQIRSAGPNALFDDADDMVYPPSPILPWSTLLVTVRGHSGDLIDNDPEGCVVTLGYSNNGTYASVVDDVAPYSFADTHRGLHTVQVSCPRADGAGLATETAVVRVNGSEQQLVELHVQLGTGLEASGADQGEANAETDSEAAGLPAEVTNGTLR